MVQISVKDLTKVREKHKDKKIVFCSGSFDVPHAGHVLFLEECKKLGDVLVVLIGTDEIIRSLKGDKRPVLNENIRLKTIDSFKPVDYIFLDPTKLGDHPLFALNKVFKELAPELYVMNEDAYEIEYRQNVVKKYGVEMVILKRTCPKEFENISTSGIIKK